MKKLIIVTMIAACVALCAAVWPHGNAVKETPAPVAETAVSAKEATVAEIEEPATLAEKEKGKQGHRDGQGKTAQRSVRIRLSGRDKYNRCVCEISENQDR